MDIGWLKFLETGFYACSFVRNVPSETLVLNINGSLMPVTLNLAGDPNTSWVASLLNSYGPYARAEVDLVGMPLITGWVSRFASKFAEYVFRLSGLQGGLYLNNWLVATNLYDASFNLTAILEARAVLQNVYPGDPVIIRSLTPPLHQDLINELTRNEFLLIPTRQVWLLDQFSSATWRQHSDVKRDLALEKTGGLEWVASSDFTEADYARAQELYDQLYRKKYPSFNPDYSKEFFRIGAESGWLTLTGLRKPGGPLLGVVGIIRQGEWFATPVLGYDLTLPAKLGLYRRLMLHAFKTVEAQNGKLHCSGGAGNFKKQRGAYSAVEYAAVSCVGLSRGQRLALSAMSAFLSKFVVPYLKDRVL